MGTPPDVEVRGSSYFILDDKTTTLDLKLLPLSTHRNYHGATSRLVALYVHASTFEKFLQMQ